jgi:superfamily II DNA/RNA helicase
MEREVKEKEMEREVKKQDREKPEKEKVKKEKEREKKEKEREQEREKEREEKERKEKGREKQREQSRRPKVPCPNDSILPQIIGKDRGQSAAALVVQEALNLKQRAEQLNGKIFGGSEGTSLYFQAALKFLQAASMLEAGDGEIRNESLSISIYSDTAKLCEFCAENYENQNDLAASALAYRCAALAHMRVVQGKSSAVARDRTEMLSYSGESLKSSLPKDSRGALSSSLNSQMGDILIVPEKSRSSFFRLLQFVQSTTAAMEAISKSSHAFNACKESINSSGGLDAMKKVLDMGFHDVESLIRFACVALEATGHRWNH